MRSWKTQTWAPFLAKPFGWRETLKSYRLAVDTPSTLFIRSLFTSYFSVLPQIEHDDDGLTARPNSVVSSLNNISSHHQRDIQTASRSERISGLGTIDEKGGMISTGYLNGWLSNGICKSCLKFKPVLSPCPIVPCSIKDEPL